MSRYSDTFSGGSTGTIDLRGEPEKTLCRYELTCSHASDTTNAVTVTLVKSTGDHVLDGVNTYSFADTKVLTFEASGLKEIKLTAAAVSGDITYELTVNALA